MKEEIYQHIRLDKVLRRKIADALGVEPESVYRYATGKRPTLSKPIVMQLIADYTGKTVEELKS
jgi:hypothetical protein